MNDLFAGATQNYRFSEEEIAALHQAGRRESYGRGDTVLERGDTGDSMFLILEGQVSVLYETGSAPGTMGPGTYFGELAFIDPEHKRSTTIVAHTNCDLMVLDQEAAEHLLSSHPRALFTLLRRACSFLVNKEEELIGHLIRKNRELEQSLDFLRRTKEELGTQELLAQTDSLTGLYNRRCLMDQLSKCMQRASDSGRGLAVVLLDLDNFKIVNDTLGHPAGDELLRRVAEIMRSGIRQSDLPCRLGGDEFALVLPDVKGHVARKRARTILREIERMPRLSSKCAVTTSMGGTMFRPGDSVEDVVARADVLLYRAKENGKSQLIWD